MPAPAARLERLSHRSPLVVAFWLCLAVTLAIVRAAARWLRPVAPHGRPGGA